MTYFSNYEDDVISIKKHFISIFSVEAFFYNILARCLMNYLNNNFTKICKNSNNIYI